MKLLYFWIVQKKTHNNSDSWRVLVLSLVHCFAELCCCVHQNYALPTYLIASIICSFRQFRIKTKTNKKCDIREGTESEDEHKEEERWRFQIHLLVFLSFSALLPCNAIAGVKDREWCLWWREEYFHPLCHKQSVQRRGPQSESCLTAEKPLLKWF